MDKKIAITLGDPSGVGPEVTLKALEELKDLSAYLIGSAKIAFQKADELGIKIPKNIEFIDTECDLSKIKTGFDTAEGGKTSFLALEKACQMVKDNKISAIVTAPVSKKAFHMAGYAYSGQTEVLQKYLSTSSDAQMLFVSEDFRVLLLTRHISLCDVSQVLCRQEIVKCIETLYQSLKNNFGVTNPKLALCGLNPHAGEGGLLGKEEQQILIPAIKELEKYADLTIDGPYPADTLFVKAARAYNTKAAQPYDAYIACYHDQGLTPIKLLAIDNTVNTTIGLPVIRTSPAHGTAYDIAGKNIANHSGMKTAIELAVNMAQKKIMETAKS